MTAAPDDHDHDGCQPFDAEQSQLQIDAVLEHFGNAPQRVVDLGCGDGRVLLPLARAGHQCICMDNDPDALRRCQQQLNCENLNAVLHECDFLEPWPEQLCADPGTLDAVLCLGNTFMTVHDVDQAVALLQRCAALLKPDGVIMLDDLAGEHWSELTEGNWLSGVSDDGEAQLVWADDDAVFALRTGGAVDDQCWTLRGDDRRLRLWTAGSLRLAARAAGLSGPCRLESGHLVLLGR